MTQRHLLAYLDAIEIGGAEESLRSLLSGLGEDYRITVAGMNPDVVAWVSDDLVGAEQMILPQARNKTSVRAGYAHWRAFREVKPDIVQINLRHPYACPWGTLAGLMTADAAVIAVEHLPIPAANQLQIAIKQQLTQRLDAHVAVGDRTARVLEGWVGLPSNSIEVIHNARPSDPLEKPNRSSAHAEVSAVSVGRLHEQKGFDLLIDALARVEGVSLRIVGDGPDRAGLESQAADLDLSDRITFVGWLDDPRPELARADVFVLPSRYEGLPLSIIEAMFAELAIVVTDVGSVRELIPDDETGLVIPPKNVAALADTLTRVVSDADLRRRIGSAARERALEHFSLEVMVSRYRALYDRVMA